MAGQTVRRPYVSAGRSFSFHIAKTNSQSEKAFNCALEAINITDTANITHVFFTEPSSIIEEDDMIPSLVVAWIGSQDIVDVFEGLTFKVCPNKGMFNLFQLT